MVMTWISVPEDAVTLTLNLSPPIFDATLRVVWLDPPAVRLLLVFRSVALIPELYETESATFPAKFPRLDRAIVEDAIWVTLKIRVLGLDVNEKSGAGTVSRINKMFGGAPPGALPLVAVTVAVILYFPGVAVEGTMTVS